jgi:hypothetical protein
MASYSIFFVSNIVTTSLVSVVSCLKFYLTAFLMSCLYGNQYILGKLVEEEKVEKGAVTWNTYWSYVRNAGGIAVVILTMLIFVLPVACAAFTDWWLSQWLTRVNFHLSLIYITTVKSDARMCNDESGR